MNAINRIGQKVVCITHKTVWLHVCPKMKNYPELGGVYTVMGFATLDGDIPGIHLREIGGFTCQCAQFNEQPWPLAAFRPVDTRKTDISEFKQLLNPTPTKTPEKTPEKVDA
jgi:hypothetical protein